MIKKLAIVGSRKMSLYGEWVIGQLLIKNYELKIKNFEIVTIEVCGCNREVIKVCRENNIKCRVFRGDNFEQLNEEVAEYANALLIIEGGKGSGTILLAEKFVEKGKRVMAVPGRINDENSWATNWLISQGAEMIIDSDTLTVGDMIDDNGR